MEDRYQDLANAIIVAAAKDYRKAIKILKRNPKSVAALDMKKECESFFRSGWFGALSAVDPEFLIRTLNEEESR